MAVTKLALIRDQTVPVGQPAPMHIDCRCGINLNVNSDANPCACGAIYDSRGYVIQASGQSGTEVAPQYREYAPDISIDHKLYQMPRS
jgi:hypothetical protein